MKLWPLAVVLLFSACLTQKAVPGDPIGKFAFEASIPTGGTGDFGPGSCDLSEAPDAGFEFSATFSRDPQSGQAYAEVGGVLREDTTLVGQLLITRASAPRSFASCKCDGVRVVETLKVLLLTPAQNLLAQDTCPEHPFDGGVVTDEGASPANAIRACGVLIDEVVPPGDAGCECAPCELHYRLNGGRR